MVPKRMCQVLPPRLTFGMPIAMILIRGFWEGSTDTIIDVRVTNLDSKSYKKKITQGDIKNHTNVAKRKLA